MKLHDAVDIFSCAGKNREFYSISSDDAFGFIYLLKSSLSKFNIKNVISHE